MNWRTNINTNEWITHNGYTMLFVFIAITFEGRYITVRICVVSENQEKACLTMEKETPSSKNNNEYKAPETPAAKVCSRHDWQRRYEQTGNGTSWRKIQNVALYKYFALGVLISVACGICKWWQCHVKWTGVWFVCRKGKWKRYETANPHYLDSNVWSIVTLGNLALSYND